MKKRILGRTGLSVGELSLGGAWLSCKGPKCLGGVPIVKRALELGMNLADTSADYGESERALGQALHEIGKPCIVSTKLGPPEGSKDFDPKDKKGLRRIVEQSLKNLHREVIDILMIHEPERPGQFDWYNDGVSFQGPVVDLLAELKKEGKIRFSGLGGTTVYPMARLVATGQYDVVLTAFNSSPLWREAVTYVVPEAVKQNVGVLLASPTQQGWLARRFDDEIEHGAFFMSPVRREQFRRVYKLCDETGIEIPVMCLRWALGLPGVSTVLTGPTTVEQLEQNFKAVEQGPLPADVARKLDDIAAMLPCKPADEPFGCPLWNHKYWGPGPA